MPIVVSLTWPIAQVALAGCDLGIYPEEGGLANVWSSHQMIFYIQC